MILFKNCYQGQWTTPLVSKVFTKGLPAVIVLMKKIVTKVSGQAPLFSEVFTEGLPSITILMKKSLLKQWVGPIYV